MYMEKCKTPKPRRAGEKDKYRYGLSFTYAASKRSLAVFRIGFKLLL